MQTNKPSNTTELSNHGDSYEEYVQEKQRGCAGIPYPKKTMDFTFAFQTLFIKINGFPFVLFLVCVA